ncbi:Uncharacterised protein [Chlamydia abortus]|nr:Uncharacterised protein [Chlamydia abortus]
MAGRDYCRTVENIEILRSFIETRKEQYRNRFEVEPKSVP